MVLGGETTTEVVVPEALIVPATAVFVACVDVNVVTMVVCLLGMTVVTVWPEVDTAVAEVFCS